MVKYNKLTMILIILSVAIVAIVAVDGYRPLPKDLILRFHPYVGNQPLVLHHQSYKNPGGSGDFSITDFQLFISNITVKYSTSSISELNSYHLIRFDGGTSFDQILIPKIKIKDIETLSLGIGVDPKANGTIMFTGDLDPNSRMAWNWQVGYKFLLLEGKLTIEDKQIPLVYHIGFDESYAVLNFDITDEKISNDGVINFKIDLLRLFQKTSITGKSLAKTPLKQKINYIDMSEISQVKFAPDDVKKIAYGFHHFINIVNIVNIVN
ncbi:MbnP family protein [Colwellia hornerae]|uniref:Copper-binding protein MbnP-like domain-containing protein n=1 Tax=Colwellia hornerae TaxID=89402 RepID=A0A5C6Q3A9_9GAMM|nr:MbnP family protein [Colwellia hornerae]TWX47189.1 hypothetical protein ESZ28_17660 [Colwellia hornerae]TWX54491.1 hypothetical protein ESZ26_17630 [Colwellia hornerae]TWX63271.1 hypothetical protein ESZ27_17215 [Colwellia hornerae]